MNSYVSKRALENNREAPIKNCLWGGEILKFFSGLKSLCIKYKKNYVIMYFNVKKLTFFFFIADTTNFPLRERCIFKFR